jgi:lipopolysaccharide transport system permease protein
MILSFSFGLMFGSLNVFYRDIDRIVSLLLTLMMYLTPIFYSLDMVPDRYISLFYFNPMVPIIDLWRSLFMQGEIEIKLLFISIAHMTFWLFLSINIYKKLSFKFAENL